MQPEALDDLLDRLVAEFADRAQAGAEPERADLLARVPAEHRPALERCFRMIEAGLATAPRAAATLAPGEELDGFRVVRELGRGGMAVVYEAEQRDLRRRVALKVLRPGLAIEARHVDRFRREGLAIARLKHPHIVQVHAVGEARGLHYLAMEHVGTNLAQVFAALPAPAERTPAALAEAAGIPPFEAGVATFEQALARLLAPVARAIGLAHELGLVHRDVKPSNILLHEDGRAVIADFGLAKEDGDPGLSLTGEPLGTPAYMSPEQAALTEHAVDRRTDVYSLGVTLYEGLTGRRPFAGDTVLAVLEAIRTQVPPSPRAFARVSRDAEAVVRRCMEREPDRRYASCLDLATELAALGEGRPTQAGAEASGVRGALRRTLLALGPGRAAEYVSPTRVLGLPLVHYHGGPRRPGQGLRVAKGWIAVGDLALGGIAMGPIAVGVMAWGALAVGGLCFAGMALGLVTLAGVSIGALANGGLAAGWGAAGGLAVGRYAAGGLPIGTYTLGPAGDMPEAVEFFSTWMPWWGWLLHAAGG